MGLSRRQLGAHRLAFVLAKTGGWCAYCGSLLEEENEPWHVDHVVPLIQGGRDEMDNLLAACAKCNRRKGSKSVEEFRASERQRLRDLVGNGADELINTNLLGRDARGLDDLLCEIDYILRDSEITFLFERGEPWC